MKKEDLSLLAHQLHTPLARQKWALAELLERELDEEQRRMLAEIAKHNEAMIEAVRAILALARSQHGMIE